MDMSQGSQPTWQRMLTSILNWFCNCDSDTPRDDRMPSGVPLTEDLSSPERCMRPLHDSPDRQALLQKGTSRSDRRTAGASSSSEKMTERFKHMRVPSFTMKVPSGKGSEEDSCVICLEEYSDSNPKSFLSCGHAFHLGCILEWEERGKTICPVCDVTVASSLED